MSKDKQGSTFNFEGVEQNVSGNGSVGQIGQNEATINNSKDDVPTWKPPFLELAEQVQGKTWPENTSPEIVEEFETPKLAVAAAITEIEETFEVEVTPEVIDEKKNTWADKFKAMLPLGIKLGTVALKAGREAMKKQTVGGAIIDALLDSISDEL